LPQHWQVGQQAKQRQPPAWPFLTRIWHGKAGEPAVGGGQVADFRGIFRRLGQKLSFQPVHIRVNAQTFALLRFHSGKFLRKDKM
jgi:hypothetical protein